MPTITLTTTVGGGGGVDGWPQMNSVELSNFRCFYSSKVLNHVLEFYLIFNCSDLHRTTFRLPPLCRPCSSASTCQHVSSWWVIIRRSWLHVSIAFSGQSVDFLKIASLLDYFPCRKQPKCMIMCSLKSG